MKSDKVSFVYMLCYTKINKSEYVQKPRITNSFIQYVLKAYYVLSTHIKLLENLRLENNLKNYKTKNL